jgi:hypothetical protein
MNKKKQLRAKTLSNSASSRNNDAIVPMRAAAMHKPAILRLEGSTLRISADIGGRPADSEERLKKKK